MNLRTRLEADKAEAWAQFYKTQEEIDRLNQRLSGLRAEQTRLQAVFLYLGSILAEVPDAPPDPT